LNLDRESTTHRKTMFSLPDFLPPVKTGLYLVATPIGNRGDITLRALDVLNKVELIYCEDTRTSRPLLETFALKTPLKSLHEHNEEALIPEILGQIRQGQKLALISDAGMPLISDPGYKLVKALHDHHLPVTVIPGASAVLTAAVLSGLPTDRFLFCGFVDPKKLIEFQRIEATLVFYEAPHRLLKTLEIMAGLFQNRTIAVLRELTKWHEEVVRGSFSEVFETFKNRDKILGELVIVLSPPFEPPSFPSEQEIDAALVEALKEHSLKDACTLVAGVLNLPRKEIYKRALALK
jgi:16S rRNA (cytidine1402-2'-O)-methyltransferase